MKTLLSILVLVHCGVSLPVTSQNRASTCYFGTVGIDFRTSPPTVLNNSAMDGKESPASICSPQGDILFYTNGGESPTASSPGGIWNNSHQFMDGGVLIDSGGCHSSYNGAVVLPFPSTSKNDTGLYYVFAKDCLESSFGAPYYNSGLTYSVIDMNLNGGQGKVISKYNVAVPYLAQTSQTTNHEPIAAILQGNNQDYWIFAYHNDSLHRLSVTTNGVGAYHAYEPGEGKIVIAPSRDFLIAGDRLYELEINSGDLNYIMNLDGFYNVAFSPDGTRLYSVESGILYQYDLTATNIDNSKTLIPGLSSNYNLFLAPNGRIYFFQPGATEIAAEIVCPNNLGVDCGLIINALYLNGGIAGSQFTNVMAHYLYQNSIPCGLNIEGQDGIKDRFYFTPNPGSGIIQVFAPIAYYKVEIYGLDGKLVDYHNMTSIEASLDLTHLAKGSYIVQFIANNERFSRRLILQ